MSMSIRNFLYFPNSFVLHQFVVDVAVLHNVGSLEIDDVHFHFASISVTIRCDVVVDEVPSLSAECPRPLRDVVVYFDSDSDSVTLRDAVS